MALKLPDSAVPMGDFPVAKAVDIDFDDGENLQEKLDNGKLGGGGSSPEKQDFRIFKSLEEFNEKKGTSFTVVSGVDNMKDIVNAMSNGEMLIITISHVSDSDVYFGLNASTGWTKMFTFIKANGLCDVECRTTSPSTFKRALNVDGVIGAWQELATMDNAIETIVNPTELDTNKYIKNGFYSFGDATKRTNLPVKKVGTLLVYYAGYYVIQEYILNENLRRFMRGSVDKGKKWSAWQELATAVADVDVTTIRPVNSSITGTIEYEVKNGICYVSIKDLTSTISSTEILISPAMPKSSINCTTSLVGENGTIAMIYMYKNTNLLGNFYTINARGNCSFSYPVAE